MRITIVTLLAGLVAATPAPAQTGTPAKQAIELSPVFILDFGPNQDPAKLPRN